MYHPAPPNGPRTLHRSRSTLLPFAPTLSSVSHASQALNQGYVNNSLNPNSSPSRRPGTPIQKPHPSPSRPALKLNLTPSPSPNFQSRFSDHQQGSPIYDARPVTGHRRNSSSPASPMQVDVDESFAVPLNSRTIRPNQTHRQTDALSPNKLSRAYSVQDLRRAGVFSSSNPGQEALERYPHSDWSDDVLEVIDRLGEGVGGAVHSVRHTRTGTTMARKTITTREAPIKQLVRELTMITTISHPNIVHFYGAYMSPSSSEVKVLMELCEGGSLQTVVERIKRRKGRVGEKVAGRLAEGVSGGSDFIASPSNRTMHLGFTRTGVLAFKTSDSP